MEPICVDCSKVSPPTRTEHTLRSAEHGWRLHRAHAADGTVVLQWRCPTCWRNYKRGQPGVATPPSLIPTPPGAPAKPASEAPTSAGRNSPRSIFRAAARFFRNSEPPRGQD